MLQNDEKRFEDFINENDKRANHAMIRADKEVKAKQERLQEIKRLDNEIKRVESEISKVEDKLEECRVTKEFLLECTPEDWHDTQAEKIAQERADEIIREEDEAVAQAKAEEEARRAEEGIEDEPDPELENMSDEERAQKEQEEKAATQVARKAHRQDVYEQVKAAITDDDIPMYYTTPHQLIDHFKRLEEDNLFLMQQCQDTEVMFEEVREKHAVKENTMNAMTDELKATMKTYRDQIDTEQQRCNALEARLRQGEEDAENDESERQDMLQTEEVRKVFVLCYPEQKEDRLGTIEMLTLIEKKMDRTFAELDRMEALGVDLEEKEKMKQKERRSEARLLQIEQQRIAQERRVEASRQKAMEPIKKKTGKPIMFRSAPPQRKEQVEDDQEDDQDELDRQYFFS